MANTDTLHKLEVLSARLNRIAKNINCGGCCVVASLVAPYISMYYPTVIRVLDDTNECDEANDMNAVRKHLRSKSKSSWNRKGVYFGHVMLEIKVGNTLYYYDTDGITKRQPPRDSFYMPLHLYAGFLTYEEARLIAARGDGWNKRFDRSNIKAMKACVEHFFLNSIHQPLEKLREDETKLAEKSLLPFKADVV